MLGGSYAIGRYIAGQLGRDIGETGYDFLTSPALREQLGQAVFFTATDGNHGAESPGPRTSWDSVPSY